MASAQIGQFAEQGDVGTVLHAGSAEFDAGTGTYTINGSGENMWATADAFHFAWKKMSGDVSLTADVTFPTATGNPHKKAVLMIRQSLDADSAYVDAALHASGLTSLQSRAEKGGATHEVGIEDEAAKRLRLVKRGSYFYMYVARAGEELHLAGGAMHLELKEPFYVGIGVCSHDKDVTEAAAFSNVTIGAPAQGKPTLYSTLETISVSSTDRRVVAVFKGRVEAPSWKDATSLIFKKGKEMEQIPATGGKVEPAAVQATEKLRGNERPSPDGERLASIDSRTLSVKTKSDGKTKVLATELGPKGTLGREPWSPDGKRLVYVSYQTVPE